MEDKIKSGIFIFLFGVIMLPLIQGQLHLVDVKGLDGAYSQAPKPEFSVHKWFDGSYQQEKSNYSNDWVGFRAYMVRLNNQLYFDLYSKFPAGDIVLGKDNYLYQSYYSEDYTGENKLDSTKARETLWRLKALQDTLEHLGKTVVLVHAPSKASLYSDHLPAKLKYQPALSWHNLYRHIADSLGIHQVDFNDWFVSIRSMHKDALMSRKGVHWTVYGSVLAADSFIKYIGHVRNIPMPALKWSKIERTTEARLTDDDIARSLNLIFPISNEEFAYPQVYYTGDPTKPKPKAIYIGDSFVWTLISDGMMKNANSGWEFWYYFHEMKNQQIMDNNANAIPIDGYDWLSALQNTDCLVFIYTSHNLPQLGNGFIEKAYDHYFPEKK